MLLNCIPGPGRHHRRRLRLGQPDLEVRDARLVPRPRLAHLRAQAVGAGGGGGAQLGRPLGRRQLRLEPEDPRLVVPPESLPRGLARRRQLSVVLPAKISGYILPGNSLINGPRPRRAIFGQVV